MNLVLTFSLSRPSRQKSSENVDPTDEATI